MNAKKTKKIVVLATGGTIAGLASDAAKPQNYTAGQVAVADLLQGVAHEGVELLTEQVAQIDSKDMSFAVWQSLLARVSHCLEQDDVQAWSSPTAQTHSKKQPTFWKPCCSPPSPWPSPAPCCPPMRLTAMALAISRTLWTGCNNLRHQVCRWCAQAKCMRAMLCKKS